MNQEFNIQVEDFKTIKESYLLIANNITGENQKLLDIETKLSSFEARFSSFENGMFKMMQHVEEMRKLFLTPIKGTKKEDLPLKMKGQILSKKPRATR